MRRAYVTTYCDRGVHGDEEVPALTLRFGVSADGGRWQWTEVDLCEPHRLEVETMMSGLMTVGRAFEAPVGVSRSKRRSPDHNGRTAAEANGRAATLTCPECGEAYQSPQGLGIHRAKIHGVRGAQHRPAPSEDEAT